MISLWSLCVRLVNLHGSLTLSRCLSNSLLLYDKPFLCFSSSCSCCCFVLFVCLLYVKSEDYKCLKQGQNRLTEGEKAIEENVQSPKEDVSIQNVSESRLQRFDTNCLYVPSSTFRHKLSLCPIFSVSTQTVSMSHLHRFDTNCLYVPSSTFRHSLLIPSSVFRHKLSLCPIFNVSTQSPYTVFSVSTQTVSMSHLQRFDTNCLHVPFFNVSTQSPCTVLSVSRQTVSIYCLQRFDTNCLNIPPSAFRHKPCPYTAFIVSTQTVSIYCF